MNSIQRIAAANLIKLKTPASVAATANGTGVSVVDFDGPIAFILNCGAATAGTNPTMDVTLEHSNDNSTYTAITGGAFTQVTSTASAQVLTFTKAELKPYVRCVMTIGGTSSPAFPLSVTGICLKPLQ
jgi:succinyl-CoA synthetase beta subunit